jgi:cyclic pyranopterin phosphate synthase
MVDVGAKPSTRREALARGRIRMSAEALRQVRGRRLKKGDALEASRIAGILAAKKTSETIPLCHPLALDSIEVRPRCAADGVVVEAAVRTTAKTGVEMEALAAVSAACLTIYDMTKAVDPAMVIGPIFLVEKTGGLSGDFRRKTEPRG